MRNFSKSYFFVLRFFLPLATFNEILAPPLPPIPLTISPKIIHVDILGIRISETLHLHLSLTVKGGGWGLVGLWSWRSRVRTPRPYCSTLDTRPLTLPKWFFPHFVYFLFRLLPFCLLQFSLLRLLAMIMNTCIVFALTLACRALDN